MSPSPPANVNGDDEGHSSLSDSSSGDESDGPAQPQVESLIAGREKRATAGNRLSTLLDKEAEDDELELLFAEADDDVEFDEDEAEVGSDVQFDSSSEDEDDHGPTAIEGEELEGEKELEKAAKAARISKKRKAQEALWKAPALRKRVKINPTTAGPRAGPVVAEEKPKKKSERISWVPAPQEGPTRASQRALAVQNKLHVHKRLKESEKRRLRTLALMEAAALKKDKVEKKAMTQADRMAEAERTEKRNAKSLNRWEENERLRSEEQARKLAALHNRQLDGPFIRWYSGPAVWINGRLRHVGKTALIGDDAKKTEGTMEETHGDIMEGIGKSSEAKLQTEGTPAEAAPLEKEDAGISGIVPPTAPQAPEATTAEVIPNKEATAEETKSATEEKICPETKLADETNTTEGTTADSGGISTAEIIPTIDSSTAIDDPMSMYKEPAELSAPIDDARSGEAPTVKGVVSTEEAPDKVQTPKSEESMPVEASTSAETRKFVVEETPTAAPTPSVRSTTPVAGPANFLDGIHYYASLPESPKAAIATTSTSTLTEPHSTIVDDVDLVKVPEVIGGSGGIVSANHTEHGDDLAKKLPSDQAEEKADGAATITPATVLGAAPGSTTNASSGEPPIVPHPPMVLAIHEDTLTTSATAPAPAPLGPPPPILRENSARNLLILSNFDPDAVKLRSVQQRILFKWPRRLPVPLPTGSTRPLPKKLQKEKMYTPCAIFRNQPAKFRDPKTGLAYCNAYAYKEIQKLRRGGAVWSSLMGCWVGPSNIVARGVPERFYDKTAKGPPKVVRAPVAPVATEKKGGDMVMKDAPATPAPTKAPTVANTATQTTTVASPAGPVRPVSAGRGGEVRERRPSKHFDL
jgi:vacuolar protein sorting-associated protein 72